MLAAEASENTNPDKPVASPFKVREVKTPQPAGIVEPVKEKPKTVVADEDTVNCVKQSVKSFNTRGLIHCFTSTKDLAKGQGVI